MKRTKQEYLIALFEKGEVSYLFFLILWSLQQKDTLGGVRDIEAQAHIHMTERFYKYTMHVNGAEMAPFAWREKIRRPQAGREEVFAFPFSSWVSTQSQQTLNDMSRFAISLLFYPQMQPYFTTWCIVSWILTVCGWFSNGSLVCNLASRTNRFWAKNDDGFRATIPSLQRQMQPNHYILCVITCYMYKTSSFLVLVLCISWLESSWVDLFFKSTLNESLH